MAFYPTVTAFSNNTTTKTFLQSEGIISKTPIGSMPSGLATITCAEYSTGANVVTVLTLNGFVVGAQAGAAAALGVGNIIYSFPTGDQHLELVYSFDNISLTCAGTAVAGGKLGLGSVVASGAISVLSGTSTFQDRLTGVTVPTASTGGAATSSGPVGATAGIGTGIALNGTGAIKDVLLNYSGTMNANNTGNLTASGRIFIQWTRMSF